MERVKGILSFFIFFLFILIFILATSTTSVFVEKFFQGKNVIFNFFLLIVYLFLGSIVLNTFLKLKGSEISIKSTFFVIFCMEMGLISFFTLEHILFKGASIIKLTTLLFSSILFLLSLLKSVERQ